MEALFSKLGVTIPDYDPDLDPIRLAKKGRDSPDWTQSDDETKRVVAMAEKIETEFKARRKLNRKTKPEHVDPKSERPDPTAKSADAKCSDLESNSKAADPADVKSEVKLENGGGCAAASIKTDAVKRELVDDGNACNGANGVCVDDDDVRPTKVVKTENGS
jgi:hypothetical protein